jgi:hypothetical protein
VALAMRMIARMKMMGILVTLLLKWKIMVETTEAAAIYAMVTGRFRTRFMTAAFA